MAVTNSRTFGLSRAQTHTMVPLVDMINHDPSRVNCEVSSDWEGTVTLSATRKVGRLLCLTPICVRTEGTHPPTHTRTFA